MQPSNTPLFYFCVVSVLATLAGTGAYYAGSEAWRVALAGIAFVFTFVAIAILSAWIAGVVNYHKWQANNREANTPAVAYANALRPLNDRQLEMASRFMALQAQGRITNVGVMWNYVGVSGKNVPVEWAGEYLERSQATWPELYPVRGKDGDAWTFEDQENARAFTDLLVVHGFALPAAGRRAAVLQVGIGDLVERLGLVL